MTFSTAKQAAYILEVGTRGAGDLATSAVSIFCHCFITEEKHKFRLLATFNKLLVLLKVLFFCSDETYCASLCPFLTL